MVVRPIALSVSLRQNPFALADDQWSFISLLSSKSGLAARVETRVLLKERHGAISYCISAPRRLSIMALEKGLDFY